MMWVKTRRFSERVLFTALMAVALPFTGGLRGANTVLAQEPAERTLSERAKEYWDKFVAEMESAAKSAGDEYGKLKSEALKETGPAREKMAERLDALGKKWSAAREKLTASIESRMQKVGAEMKNLEERAGKETGPAREKLVAEMEKLKHESHVAREKMSTALSSGMKATTEEFSYLKERAASSTAETRAKLAPKMEHLKAEWTKTREKLSTYLEADLKQTQDELEKIGEATSGAAKKTKDKLKEKYDQLRTRIDDLKKEKAPESD